MFDNPTFTTWNIIFTAIGSIVLWGTWGRKKLKPFVISSIVEAFCSGRLASVIEFAIFIVLGTIVGVGIVKPINPAQALTAGLAWTGALARPDYQVTKP